MISHDQYRGFFNGHRGPNVRVELRYLRDPWLPKPRRRPRVVQALRSGLAVIKRCTR